MRWIAAWMWIVWAAAAEAALEDVGLEPKNIAFVEVKGVVVRADTAVPVADASVLAIWEGTTYGPHSSDRHCLRIAAARTGIDGSFSLVAPASAVHRSGMAQQYVDIRVYQTGLEEVFPPGTDARPMRLEEVGGGAFSKLAKVLGPKEYRLGFTGRLAATREDIPDRLRTLLKLSRHPLDCETRDSLPEVQRFFNSITREAAAIAKTRYQRAVAAVLESDARLALHNPTAAREASMKIMDAAYSAIDADDLERRDWEDMTPLMQAASKGDAVQVQALLARGASPNRRRGVNDLTGGDSAITLAMSRYLQFTLDKNADAARYPPTIQAILADPRADPNVRDRPVDYTPLMKALYHRQADVVEWLLARGADPTLTAYSDQYSALSVALGAMNTAPPLPEATRQLDLLLASKKVNLDFVNRYDGNTALIAAIAFGNAEIAVKLLRAGAGPNATDRSGRAPLVVAAQAAILNPQWPKYVAIVKAIAEWPGVRDGVLYKGKTALQMAKDANRPELVAILERVAR